MTASVQMHRLDIYNRVNFSICTLNNNKTAKKQRRPNKEQPGVTVPGCPTRGSPEACHGTAMATSPARASRKGSRQDTGVPMVPGNLETAVQARQQVPGLETKQRTASALWLCPAALAGALCTAPGRGVHPPEDLRVFCRTSLSLSQTILSPAQPASIYEHLSTGCQDRASGSGLVGKTDRKNKPVVSGRCQVQGQRAEPGWGCHRRSPDGRHISGWGRVKCLGNLPLQTQKGQTIGLMSIFSNKKLQGVFIFLASGSVPDT